MNQEKKEVYRILGVDPGTNVLGYALIEVIGKSYSLVHYGVVYMEHLEDQHAKLKRIFERISEIIRLYEPKEMAIEQPFYAKNVQVMLKLGRAQGVAIAAAAAKDIPVTEYAARKIKQSVAGNGNATKEQVAAMLEMQFKEKLQSDFSDATDALAIAICHFYQHKFTSPGGSSKKKSGWAGFIKENPNRLK